VVERVNELIPEFFRSGWASVFHSV
jgi:hypothetical protein